MKPKTTPLSHQGPLIPESKQQLQIIHHITRYLPGAKIRLYHCLRFSFIVAFNTVAVI